MKQKLVILSDLWGKRKMDWWRFYYDALEPYFDISFYDCAELAGIDITVIDEKELHEQFTNGGIDKAVQKLIDLEKERIMILAFSIGGVIAWKYVLKTSSVVTLYCISSTRLRKEKVKPEGEIHLWYGANDMFKPSLAWFDENKIEPVILRSKGHELYKDMRFAQQLCAQILND